MSSLSRVKLSDDLIAQRLGALDGWSIEQGMLRKRFEFGSYSAGVMFAAAVGQLADGMDHHPDLFIGYRKVDVALVTHDAGGLTELDFALAERIETL